MSSEVWFVKQNGGLFASDEESDKLLAGIEDGECQAFELIGVRDPVSFRKYWKMCDVIAKNVHEIRFDRLTAPLPISTREDVSDAIKLGVGLYTRLPAISTELTFCKVESISYARMTPAKWAEYIRRVAPFVIDNVLPDVANPYAQDDLLRMTSKWLREVEREGAQEQAA
jgi:hypothetical protein